jgi:hypothetical protein
MASIQRIWNDNLPFKVIQFKKMKCDLIWRYSGPDRIIFRKYNTIKPGFNNTAVFFTLFFLFLPKLPP